MEERKHLKNGVFIFLDGAGVLAKKELNNGPSYLSSSTAKRVRLFRLIQNMVIYM